MKTWNTLHKGREVQNRFLSSREKNLTYKYFVHVHCIGSQDEKAKQATLYHTIFMKKLLTNIYQLHDLLTLVIHVLNFFVAKIHYLELNTSLKLNKIKLIILSCPMYTPQRHNSSDALHFQW